MGSASDWPWPMEPRPSAFSRRPRGYCPVPSPVAPPKLPSPQHPHSEIPHALAHLAHRCRPGLHVRGCAGPARFPLQTHPRGGRLPGRRPAGPACAAADRQAAGRAGPARGGGLQGRGGRHGGRAGCDEGAARRPYADAGQHGRDGHQPGALRQAALLHAQGISRPSRARRCSRWRCWSIRSCRRRTCRSSSRTRRRGRGRSISARRATGASATWCRKCSRRPRGCSWCTSCTAAARRPSPT